MTVIAYCTMWTLDIISFVVSEIALHYGKRGTNHIPIGAHLKADVIGSLVSLAVIWSLSLWVFILATKVWFSPDKVDGGKMLIVAIISLFFNFKDFLGKCCCKKDAPVARD